MAKYIKFPTIAYEATEFSKYMKSKGLGEDDELLEEWQVAQRKANAKDVDKPYGVTVFTRYALSELEGCSYEASCGVATSDLDWGPKRFTSSMLYFKNGDAIQVEMPVQALEDLLINHGIVDADIKEQYPNSTL